MDDNKAIMKQWLERMRQLQQEGGDTEAQHSLADDILCEALNYLGAEELVTEWQKVPKWYA